ncbi:hypothetical protein BD410DRAFT_734343 [Rickenella mellea]|uniref:DUF6533 domain-containing protein n=1 Tax=Rickenella mellea TaxID=50990 RepID=A0A4Y7PHH1_9AGAM|nr:hypothetical protein BD410DRAFT_734343 [Rickenella mellea]
MSLTVLKVLVIYDYFLTLPTEVSEIWNSKFSGAQACFFVTRYSYIVYTLFLFALNFVKNPSQTVGQQFPFNYVVWLMNKFFSCQYSAFP